MDTLPGEINTDILLRLPIKTLCTLKCVCKPWKTLISSPHFTKSHRHRSSTHHRQLLLATSSLYTLNIIDDESPQFPPPIKLQIPLIYRGSIELVGSCDGLVCLLLHHHHYPSTFSLLNPITKEYKTLPDPGSFPPDAKLTLSGFGYVDLADDYKVIKIATDNTGVGESMAKVYSAKGNSWKTIQAYFPFRVFPWVKPVYVNGVVHWLCFGGKFPPTHKIIGFDFVEENFKILPLPEKVNQRSIKCLGVLGGCLCIFARKNDPPCLEMWEMLEYGVGESWIKTLTIPRGYDSSGVDYLYPVCYLKDKILMRVDYKNLVLYDPGEWRFVDLKVKLREGKYACDVAVYEESLVSPSDYIGQDVARTDNMLEENEGE